MESSPVSENSKMEVDLCTPAENLKKHCQEITPDISTQPETKPLLGAKKAIAVGFSQKLSKRKLFGQLVDQAASGNENVFETFLKKKRSDDPIKNVTNDNTQKRLLTERQQLAFLLEATSTRESADDENDNTFTKVKSRKRIKRNGKCVNSRVYRRNERGETPLHLAAIKGDIVSLKKLIKDGAEVGLKDYAGWTALHEACNHGNLEAAKHLVKHGAAVNVPGFEGDTPLHDAVVNNHVEVVNMLLSCGANPHQTNTKRKNPTDLISSKEMSDIFNLRGVQHTAFEKTDMKILSEEITASGSAEKTHNSDNERSHLRGSILGNEIQRKETQGESKMEKPVMYICKLEPRNEELTIRTTQVTSYKKCSNVEEDEGSDPKNIASEGCKVQSQKPDTPTGKKVLGIGKTDGQDDLPTEIESLTSRQGNVLKNGASSLQVESRGQPDVYGNTKNKSVSASASEDFKTGAQETENKLVSNNDQDKVNTKTKVKMLSYGSENLSFRSQETEHSENKHVSINNNENTKAKLALSSNGSEELNNRSKEIEISEKKQDSIRVHGEENENTKRDPSLFMPASEDPPTESREKKNSQVYIERSRTPEIDESIAVEVLSTGLFSGAPGFSQCYGHTFLGLQDKVMKNPSYIYSDASATDVYTSGGQRFETLKNPSYSYRGVYVADVQTSLNEGLVEQEASEQSSISNDELFLDVEGLEPDLKENIPSLEVHLLKKERSAKQPKEQENVISSTSNDNNDDVKTKEHAASFIPMNERSGLPTVYESGQIRKQSNAHDSSLTYLSNSYGGKSQSDTLGASKLTEQRGNKFTSENIVLNTERSKKTTILDRSSAVEHTHLTPWKFAGTTSEKDGNRYGEEMVSKVRPVKRATTFTGGDNLDDFRPWQLEKKRERRKVDLRKSTFTREDEITRRKAGQPISSSNHNITSWEADTRFTTGRQQQELRNSQGGKESTRLAHGVSLAVVKPSEPKVTWQSLMAAGRCHLAELRIPGFDQFLMKTKEYELATDVNQEKSIEAPAHSTSTEEKDISLKHEKSKEELLRKQRSEQEKLQLCMEQEIVRFYTKKAYSSLKCNQPPGVCTAIYWQNMSSHQLQNEKKKLSQKLYLEKDQTSPSDHQEITEKYEKLKSAMANRHKHEQQALDVVTKRELQSCV